MLVKPDFTEVSEAISSGTYKVVIKKGELKEWPNGGTYVNWLMETYGEAQTKNNGRSVWHKTPTSGKAAFHLQNLYKAATGKQLAGQFDTEELVGRQVEVTVVDGVRNGEATGFTEIKAVRPVTTN